MRNLPVVRNLVIGVIIVIVILMMADFNNRVAEMNRLKVEHSLVAAEVTERVQTQMALETQIAYATSESAVEEWAYEQGRMVRPGDVPVVPLPAGPEAATPTPAPTPTPEPLETWQVWWRLFFGK